jgi:hypothetical protein
MAKKYEKIIRKIYPKNVCDIWSALTESKLEIKNNYSDGRLNSAINENYIIEILEKRLEGIIKSTQRGWYDFMYKDIPFNIKITKGSTDNVWNKKALIYSLTTNDITKVPYSGNWKTFVSLIQKNKKTKRDYREYYYLVIYKDDRMPIIKSIIDIVNLRANPTNILQVDWKKEYNNSTDYEREISKAHNKLIQIIKKSGLKKSEDLQYLLDMSC